MGDIFRSIKRSQNAWSFETVLSGGLLNRCGLNRCGLNRCGLSFTAAAVIACATSPSAVSSQIASTVPRATNQGQAPLPTLSASFGSSSSGELRLLTYNVAGLPEWLSPSLPSRNQPLASPLFNPYDLVLTQEDWAYHHLLTQQVEHPFIALPSERSTSFLGDGLSLFSVFPLGTTQHIAWTHCNGYLTALSDCLADKGFSVTRIQLTATTSLDLINLHADAGGQLEDANARQREFEQLRTFIENEEQGRALIVAGDTNLDLRNQQDSATSRKFVGALGLQDACEVLHCTNGGIDRVLYRSSVELLLSAQSHRQDPRFVDAQGLALSDHPALAVTLSWEEPLPRTSLALHAQTNRRQFSDNAASYESQ